MAQEPKDRQPEPAARRPRLNREAVLCAGVELADQVGIEGFTMRTLSQELGVVPMALYKHVANKQELLEGMVDLVWNEVTEPDSGHGWKQAMHDRAASLRAALVRHRWAVGRMEAAGRPGPESLRQHNAMLGCLRQSGFSFRTTVHVMSLLDAYVYGCALQQKTLSFETPEESAEAAAATRDAESAETAARYPYLLEVVGELAKHGYDYDAEFTVGLDVLLDGIDTLRGSWHSGGATPNG
ncbi:TetR/AcrR family transcriptional regulator C-terminal domain-containing protein [Arthrobacter sp. zg-Y820]|uniref:TetR/AcrR family transcriptional regulator C-terminal domain-containing protein n=1 Tax=unclassified Arthrobacter TaxID=235627 RepID=UPI001E5A16F4|nr:MULTISPECIES: TetR/AcrR family transcriptional regulator C-terminal domain-containing protein [unclassified Arthrobacter]MCC9197571.1 TetR/AcrR family transcriptional regulator C-terminal domain-containing protein [Arthrobacter sp. zg-Y820]MDK1280438.1 TetR/AcrR family transcriptional regulator C-terminal domain-containing protein [Arthrobacter sp. zg.Y820]WIB10918.1 TetR/AcrR family transcriptional regulator C-terminal domain-containing protein [Arthrobacter sp. zg-Y820]